MACALALFGIDKKVYGFDSFEGFPDASVHDLSRRVSSVGRPVGWTDTSPEMVNRVFIEDCEKNPNTLFASGPPRPVLVKGFFSDTLEAGLPEKIALLHVDCDLYDSTRDVLRACWARMQPGSTVVFDEYDDVKWPGAKLAVDEFCSKQGKQLVYSSQLQRHTVLV